MAYWLGTRVSGTRNGMPSVSEGAGSHGEISSELSLAGGDGARSLSLFFDRHTQSSTDESPATGMLGQERRRTDVTAPPPSPHTRACPPGRDGQVLPEKLGSLFREDGRTSGCGGGQKAHGHREPQRSAHNTWPRVHYEVSRTFTIFVRVELTSVFFRQTQTRQTTTKGRWGKLSEVVFMFPP